MRKPTMQEVERAEAELDAEDERERLKNAANWFLPREESYPSWDPRHVHGLGCDGQDGRNSRCVRLRRKLGLA